MLSYVFIYKHTHITKKEVSPKIKKYSDDSSDTLVPGFRAGVKNTEFISPNSKTAPKKARTPPHNKPDPHAFMKKFIHRDMLEPQPKKMTKVRRRGPISRISSRLPRVS